MKKMILTGLALVCLTASPVWGEGHVGDEGVLDSKVSHRADGYHQIGFQVPLADTDTEEGRAFMAEIPSAYDQRWVLPPVRDQGDYGACWAFAAMASAEGGLIFQGKQVGGEIVDNSVDLSEYQLAHFMYFNVDDPLQNTGGDQTIALEGGRDISGPASQGRWRDYLDAGGNNCYATWTMAGWKAGADEASAPYDSIAATQGRLDSSAAFQDKVHMQNAYWISMEQPDLIKQMIMHYGAAAASYMDGAEAFDRETDAYYSGLTYEEALSREDYGGHAIALVGWDDDYSRDDFQEGCRPDRDGAWLVRNSWGDWGDQGYFWISYEEQTMEDMVIVCDFEDAEDHDYNYQYDGSCGVDSLDIQAGQAVANVFQVKGEGEQLLDAVGIGLADTDLTFSIQIYKDPPRGRPERGIPMFSVPQRETELCVGYHTIRLQQPVFLEQGHTFSVVFTFEDAGRVFVDSTYRADWIRFVNETAPDQSFLLRGDGSSIDLHTGTSGYWGGDPCSVRIKAFTKRAAREVVQKASPGQDGLYECRYLDGQPAVSATISAPARIQLSADVVDLLDGDGRPSVVGVYDADGYMIDPSHYTISYSAEDPAILGEHSVRIDFHGDLYTGSLEREYTLVLYLPPVQDIRASSSSDKIRLSWREDERADGYYVYAAASPNGRYDEIATLYGSSPAAYTYEGLDSGQDYHLQVRSYKKIEDQVYVSDAWEVLRCATSPAKVKSLRASGQTTRTVRLSWERVRGASGYQIYRYGRGWELAADVSGAVTSYTDKDRRPGTTQRYKVRAFRENGSYRADGSFSDEMITSTTPAKVGSLQVSARGRSYVKLRWEKTKGASGYQIYVYNRSRGDYVRVATVAKGSTVSRKMGSLKKASEYRYKVRAYRKVDGKTIYGPFSRVKKVRTKK